MKFTVIVAALIVLTGCSSDREKIVREVCDPASAGGGPTVQELAKAKGYDLEHAREICREHFQDRLRKLSSDMKDSGLTK